MPEIHPDNTQKDRPDHFNNIIAVIIAVITVLIAVITYLQSDASSRDDTANRDSKRYSIEAFGRNISGDAKVNFDYNKAYLAYYEYDLLAKSAASRDDEATALRYTLLRDQMKTLSPLLAPPYFNPGDESPKVEMYEADTYLVETTALFERYIAASAVKEAWDSKSNAYIFNLTLLAVSLFLFGMSTTISRAPTRLIFAASGLVVTIFAIVGSVILYLQPVPDLRNCKTNDGRYAIDAFAQGVGLAYQGEYENAIAEYDRASACEPVYINALIERGNANLELGNYEKAASDFEKARAAGDLSANTAGNLAWTYYILGQFPESIKLGQTALNNAPDELWIRFNQGICLLAANQKENALKEFEQGMDQATRQVSEARSAGKEPSSNLWVALDSAALSLDDLVALIVDGQGKPPVEKISDPVSTKKVAIEISKKLKSLSVALEYTGKPPSGEPSAKISPFVFAQPIYNDAGDIIDYNENEVFAHDTTEVAVIFDYENMQDGADTILKVIVNGQEDPSWRMIETWSLGSSGTAEKILSFSYSGAHPLSAGYYVVELYVNSHLAQSGAFTIEAKK